MERDFFSSSSLAFFRAKCALCEGASIALAVVSSWLCVARGPSSGYRASAVADSGRAFKLKARRQQQLVRAAARHNVRQRRTSNETQRSTLAAAAAAFGRRQSDSLARAPSEFATTTINKEPSRGRPGQRCRAE